MMNRRIREAYEREANRIIEKHLSKLCLLSYEDALKLPESDGHDCSVASLDASVTVFRQTSPYGLDGQVLVTVLVARSIFAGMFQKHIEKGLVFSPNAATRVATEIELQNTGG